MIKLHTSSKFTKISKGIATDERLSDKAVRLYLILSEVNPGRDFNQQELAFKLNSSLPSLNRAIKELKTADLLYVHKVGIREYVGIIGLPGKSAYVAYRDLYPDSVAGNK